MDHMSQFETQNYGTLEQNIGKNICALKLGKDSLDTT